MSFAQNLEQAATRFILDPKNHDALTLVKGVRNGIVYGTKVRFPHALVMIFLFRSGTFRDKLYQVFKATKTHARNLGLFSLIYKSVLMALRSTSPTGKPRSVDPFLAGAVGGFYVFGRSKSSVSQQIVTYVFARVALGAAKLAVKPRSEGHGGWELVRDAETREAIRRHAWPVFASFSWAAVMWMFTWHPEVVQPSMRSSMQYIYADSDHWDSLKNFLWHNK